MVRASTPTRVDVGTLSSQKNVELCILSSRNMVEAGILIPSLRIWRCGGGKFNLSQGATPEYLKPYDHLTRVGFRRLGVGSLMALKGVVVCIHISCKRMEAGTPISCMNMYRDGLLILLLFMEWFQNAQTRIRHSTRIVSTCKLNRPATC